MGFNLGSAISTAVSDITNPIGSLANQAGGAVGAVGKGLTAITSPAALATQNYSSLENFFKTGKIGGDIGKSWEDLTYAFRAHVPNLQAPPTPPTPGAAAQASLLNTVQQESQQAQALGGNLWTSPSLSADQMPTVKVNTLLGS